MAHSFNTTSGRKTFGTFKPSLYASDYITNKKAKAVFCDSSVCPKGISESNLLLLKNQNHLELSFFWLSTSFKDDYNICN